MTGRAELTPAVICNIEAGAKLSAEDYLHAERRRSAIYRSFRELFARADFLVAPAASVFRWPNEVSDVTVIDSTALETAIDYLAVTSIVSLVGFWAASESARPMVGLASGRRNVSAVALRRRSATNASAYFTAATTWSTAAGRRE
jgi:Asp-tRNA(Asn)/Glu-tRNA(Gln) amidotransferase A subunit family amidase